MLNGLATFIGYVHVMSQYRATAQGNRGQTKYLLRRRREFASIDQGCWALYLHTIHTAYVHSIDASAIVFLYLQESELMLKDIKKTTTISLEAPWQVSSGAGI